MLKSYQTLITGMKPGEKLHMYPSEAALKTTCDICGDYNHTFGEFLVGGNDNGLLMIERIR